MPRKLASVVVLVVATGTFWSPASAQSPAPRANDCFGLGRTFGGGSWSPDGSAYVFATSDRTTTRLERISFPGMDREVLAEAGDPTFTFLSPTYTDADTILFGSVEGGSAWLSHMDLADPSTWSGYSARGFEQAVSLAPVSASATHAILSASDVRGQSSLAQVALVSEDVTSLELPPSIPRPAAVSAPADGSFLLVGADNGSGSSFDWSVVRDGEATPFEFHDDVLRAYVSDDGSRVFYTSNTGGNDTSLVRSLAIDGTDLRGEFRRSDVEGLEVSSTGIAAFGGYVPSFDGAPILPEPPGTNSWTPTSALCFARTGLAAPDVPYPSAMPPDDPVETIEFAAVPAGVVTLVGSLPRAIGDAALHWETGGYTDGEPVPTRVTDASGLFPLARLVALGSGATPDDLFADRATLVGADGMPSTAILSYISIGGDSSWLAEVIEGEITARDHGAYVDEVTLAGRPARAIGGLRTTEAPEPYAQYPEYVAAFRNMVWPETTTYLLPTDDAVFIISTDDMELAERVARAALGA